MKKVVIFDWVGVLMHGSNDENNYNQAMIRIIKSYNPSLTDNEAWNIYKETLVDENGIYISRQEDKLSKDKWVKRISDRLGLVITTEEFSNRFVEELLKGEVYKETIDYALSLKKDVKIGLFSDLIYCCEPVLAHQVDLSQFDYIWLSFRTHLRKNTIEAFENVEKDLQVQPSDILFIDDTEVNIENARRRGWNTCQAFGYELDKIRLAVQNFLGIIIETDDYKKKLSL